MVSLLLALLSLGCQKGALPSISCHTSPRKLLRYGKIGNKIVSKALNSCIFVRIWKLIGCGGITKDTTGVRAVAERSHNPRCALLDPSAMGDTREKTSRVASTPLDRVCRTKKPPMRDAAKGRRTRQPTK